MMDMGLGKERFIGFLDSFTTFSGCLITFLVNFSVGYFSGNRYGADVDFFRPFKDERFSLLARIGYTGAGRWDGFKFNMILHYGV